MKLAQPINSVVASRGAGDSTGFKIASSPHAFKMLSSGLYSDKIGAVLREIGCNAADAHIAGGCPNVPIEVKLPNQLDPVFYIRDRGPGLSDEDVRNLYTTYFASTKQSSNDFTGAFGLGSKSPYAYTNTFSVTSCHNGRMYSYVAHLDKNGSPVITPMGESEADDDWKSGVMISFPVRVQDFKEFQDKAREIYQWFSPRPSVRGLEDNWAPTRRKWHEDQNIVLFGDEFEASVLMGNVRYPLDSAELFPNTSKFRMHRLDGVEQFAYAPFALKLPIGSVQVAANREQLQYDDESRAYLKNALETAYFGLVDETAVRLATAYRSAAGWNQRVAVYEVWRNIPHLLQKSQRNRQNSKLQKLGLSTADIQKLWSYTNNDRFAVPTSVTSEDKGVTVKVLHPSGRKELAIVRNGRYMRGENILPATVGVCTGAAIFVGDCDKAEERLLASGKAESGLFVNVRARDRRSECTVVAQATSEAMDNMPIVLVSSLPELPVVEKEKVEDVMVPILKLDDTMANAQTWIAGTTPKKLSTLEESEMFYLVRDGQPGQGSTRFTFEHLDDEGNRVILDTPTFDSGVASMFQSLRNAMGYLGLAGLLPTGFILVTPVQVTRLKLVERGLRPLTGLLRELTQMPAFSRALAVHGVNGVTREFSGYWGAPSTDILLTRLRSNPPLFDAVLARLPEEDRQLLTAVRDAREFSSDQKTIRNSVENAFGQFWKFFDIKGNSFVSATQLREVLCAKYPLLPFLHSDTLRTSNDEVFMNVLPRIFEQHSMPEQMLKAA